MNRNTNTSPTAFDDVSLMRINKELGLGADTADELRSMYDSHDLRYMIETGKEPPTALEIAHAFNKYVAGLRVDTDGWTQVDTCALAYATGNFGQAGDLKC